MRQGISNRVISANIRSDQNCVVVGSGVKDYGTSKMHNKGVLGSARGPNIHYCLVVAVKEELLSRPLMPPEKASGPCQELITRSLQLPHIPVTAISQTDLFLV